MKNASQKRGETVQQFVDWLLSLAEIACGVNEVSETAVEKLALQFVNGVVQNSTRIVLKERLDTRDQCFSVLFQLWLPSDLAVFSVVSTHQGVLLVKNWPLAIHLPCKQGICFYYFW